MKQVNYKITVNDDSHFYAITGDNDAEVEKQLMNHLRNFPNDSVYFEKMETLETKSQPIESLSIPKVELEMDSGFTWYTPNTNSPSITSATITMDMSDGEAHYQSVDWGREEEEEKGVDYKALTKNMIEEAARKYFESKGTSGTSDDKTEGRKIKKAPMSIDEAFGDESKKSVYREWVEKQEVGVAKDKNWDNKWDDEIGYEPPNQFIGSTAGTTIVSGIDPLLGSTVGLESDGELQWHPPTPKQPYRVVLHEEYDKLVANQKPEEDDGTVLVNMDALITQLTVYEIVRLEGIAPEDVEARKADPLFEDRFNTIYDRLYDLVYQFKAQ